MTFREMVLRALADCKETKRGQTIVSPQKDGSMFRVRVEYISGKTIAELMSQVSVKTKTKRKKVSR